MRLIEDRLDKLRTTRQQSTPTRHTLSTHISFHVNALRLFFDAHQVAQHATHQVFAKDDDFLAKVANAGRIAREACLWHPISDSFREGLRDSWSRQN